MKNLENEEEYSEHSEQFELGKDYEYDPLNSLINLTDWGNYLHEQFKETFPKKNVVCKVIAYLLKEYYQKRSISLYMPTVTLDHLLNSSGKDNTKIGVRMFNAIQVFKESKLINRSGTKRDDAYVEFEMSYSDLGQSKFTLKPKACVDFLNLPGQFLELCAGSKEESEYGTDRWGYKYRKDYSNPDIGRVINPKVKLEDCILSKKNLTEIKGFIKTIKNREKLLIWGIEYAPKLLLAGTIGTGKSRTAEAIANELGMYLYRVSNEDVVASYLGETAKNIAKAFNHAKTFRNKLILFIDEIEGVIGKRMADSGASREVSRAVNTFLTLMEESKQLIIMGATNHFHQVDLAAQSRFTKTIWYELPDKEMLFQIFRIHLKNIPLDPRLELDKMIEKCIKLEYSGRDIRNLIVEITQEMLLYDKDQLTNKTIEKCMDRIQERDFKEKSKQYEKYLKGETSDYKVQVTHKIDPALSPLVEQQNFDELDKNIVAEIKKDSKISFKKLSEILDTPTTTLYEKFGRLKNLGVVKYGSSNREKIILQDISNISEHSEHSKHSEKTEYESHYS